MVTGVRRVRNVALALLAVVVVAIAGWVVGRIVDPRVTSTDVRVARETAARQAGRAFLDRYVEADGRVVRRDEGGDVVSEGQGYAMLIAAAVGDEARFRTVWDWTRTHLLRPDGLLTWRWADGGVSDANSAADADLDVARSLLVAGRRFREPTFTADGRRLGAQVVELETVPVGTRTPPPEDLAPPGQWVIGDGRVTVAGSWVTGPPYAVNPSYFNPRAEGEFAADSRDPRWEVLGRTERALAWQLYGAGQLPPDWAVVDEAGYVAPTPPPPGGPTVFGLDAARLPVRFAESCNPEDRTLAASMRTVVGAKGDVPALRNLDGSAASDWQHPVSLVAAAATDQAAGDGDSAASRLDQATALLQRYPTYYGAAWVALGRIMLTTSLLGACPASP